MTMRIGIFGGSFDPVHIGHLLLAELCAESLRLDRLKFVVANMSPLKTHRKMADNRHRIEMLKLAIGGNRSFEIDTREIDRGGISYTIDTVRSILNELPDASLFFLMGADVLPDLAKWKEPTELFKLVTPAVIARGGVGNPDWSFFEPFVDPLRLIEIKRTVVAVPQMEISSTDLKSRIRNGKSIRYQVPASVDAYIREHQLYAAE